MDPAAIIALIAASLSVLGGGTLLGKRLFDKFKARTADNTAKWNTVGGARELLEDVVAIYGEEANNIKELISQVMTASKAIDKQKTAVQRIEEDAALRNALKEAAVKLGPEALDKLSEVMTPIPKDLVLYGGAHLDMLNKIKEAQRMQLSSKETMNIILENSNKMAKGMIDAAKALAKVTK